MRLDQASLAPAINVAAAGFASMILGVLLWMYDDDEPMVDLGGDE